MPPTDPDLEREQERVEHLARILHDAYEQTAPRYGFGAERDARTWDESTRARRTLWTRIAAALLAEDLADMADPGIRRVAQEASLASVSLLLAAEDLERGADRQDTAGYLRSAHGHLAAALSREEAPPGAFGSVAAHDPLRPELGWYRPIPERVHPRGPLARAWRSIAAFARGLADPRGETQEAIDEAARVDRTWPIGAGAYMDFGQGRTSSIVTGPGAPAFREEVERIEADLRGHAEGIFVGLPPLTEAGKLEERVALYEQMLELPPLDGADLEARRVRVLDAMRGGNAADYRRHALVGGAPDGFEDWPVGARLEYQAKQEPVDAVLPLDVTCPTCGSKPEAPCTNYAPSFSPLTDPSEQMVPQSYPHEERAVLALKRSVAR